MADDDVKYRLTPQGAAFVEYLQKNPISDRRDFFGGGWDARQAEIDRLTKELAEAGKAILAGYQRRGEIETRLDEAREDARLADQYVADLAELLADDLIEDDVAAEAIVFDAIKRVITEREDARALAVRLESEVARLRDEVASLRQQRDDAQQARGQAEGGLRL